MNIKALLSHYLPTSSSSSSLLLSTVMVNQKSQQNKTKKLPNGALETVFNVEGTNMHNAFQIIIINLSIQADTEPLLTTGHAGVGRSAVACVTSSMLDSVLDNLPHVAFVEPNVHAPASPKDVFFAPSAPGTGAVSSLIIR